MLMSRTYYLGDIIISNRLLRFLRGTRKIVYLEKGTLGGGEAPSRKAWRLSVGIFLNASIQSLAWWHQSRVRVHYNWQYKTWPIYAVSSQPSYGLYFDSRPFMAHVYPVITWFESNCSQLVQVVWFKAYFQRRLCFLAPRQRCTLPLLN